MKLNQLEYKLQKRLIANSPATPRDSAKLLVIDRVTQKLSHHKFRDILNMLNSNDVLVFNQTKVFPARIFGTKDTGGKVEILLLEKTAGNAWIAMKKGKVRFGQTLVFAKLQAKVVSDKQNLIKLKFSCRENELFTYLEKHGHTPIPPYIKPENAKEKDIRKSYQTVYARTTGSIAAPTAGFHFTKNLISKLSQKGVQMEYVTLHVGPGTFLPIKEANIAKHDMHAETFLLDAETADSLNRAKRAGKRIIAVGTTTTRVLETLSSKKGVLKNGIGKTKLFIYPPYKFKFVDSLITNFHLPHSTLLALVSAFVTFPNTREKFSSFKTTLVGKAYKEAVKKNYRFYSFGDATFIK